jgi:competence protein ComEA
MSSPPPPPFVLPPGGPGSRVRALLAGAGRQRVAVGLLVLVALAGAGVVWLRAAPRLAGGAGSAASADQTLPRAAPDPRSGVSGSAADPGGAGSGAAPDGSLAGGPAGQVAVHVAGRVRRPGLVRLPAGSRVQDAIRAAGGPTAGADLDAVNLARKLTDGEQIRVPAPGDPAPPPSPGAAAGPGAPGAGPSAPLDLNTATLEQLDTLPGVGEVTAGRIVAYRPFTAVDELLEVPGIGQRRYDQLKDLVTVG